MTRKLHDWWGSYLNQSEPETFAVANAAFVYTDISMGISCICAAG